jgi:hypothetical protein
MKKGFFSRLIEKLGNNNLGERIDDLLMNITDRRWKRKTAANKLNSKGNPLAMCVSKHCSKPDPVNFQEKVVREYQRRTACLQVPAHEMGN